MKILLYRANQVLTCKAENGKFKRKYELNNLGLLEDSSIIIEDEKISEITSSKSFDKSDFDLVIDCRGKVILPGLIDSHTHLIFDGSRADEFELRLAGKSYEEIAQLGGGIVKTVRATRNSSKAELKKLALSRIREAISHGITTIEIKSGYGLDYETEIKMLECANELSLETNLDIIPTFLGAHTIPVEFKNNHKEYISLITQKLIPEISSKKLAKFCDVFLEKTAFSVEESKDILSTAKQYGLQLKLHCDQFNSIGGVQLGIDLNVTSIDHLEMITDDDINKLSQTDIAAVILPGVSHFLKIPFAPVRKMIDAGCIVAIATDFNPGSCTSQNLPLMMHFAALYNGMKLNETINAVTINAAYSLGIEKNFGTIEPNKIADIIILNTNDYKNLIYYFGKNFVQTVIKRGKIIYERNN
ncbi:MAG: imidazolonepropionase [Ignavibacteria bacterium]|nr:imidazolonepropionase [Ignavibacteria bacterium]